MQEDDLVVELVGRFGPRRWSLIATHLKGRIGKQCRERLVPCYVPLLIAWHTIPPYHPSHSIQLEPVCR